MRWVTVRCDRCKQTVKGLRDDAGTSGFYEIKPGSYWGKYSYPEEKVICDPCMIKDPVYRKDYGLEPLVLVKG